MIDLTPLREAVDRPTHSEPYDDGWKDALDAVKASELLDVVQAASGMDEAYWPLSTTTSVTPDQWAAIHRAADDLNQCLEILAARLGDKA